MTCINKNNKNFKLAKARYGASFAELAIRNISKSKGLIDDFYYPTIQEIKDYYKEEIKKKETLIFDALKNSTSLTLKTITDLLQGVIHKHNGIYFVTQGFGNNQSSIIRADNYTMIYRPNLEIIKKLEEMYPDIFSRTYVVKYTPPGASSNLSFVVENLNLKGREKIFDDYDLEVFKTPSKERNTILKIARIYRDVPLSIKRPFITRLTINPKLILTPVKEEVESEESLLNENLRTLGYRDRDLEVIQKEGQFISVTGNIYSSLQEALIDKDGQFEELFDPNNSKKVVYNIPAFKKLNGIQKQIEEKKKKYGEQGRFFQVKNIFNSVIELETKLKTVNKTPNAIGNDKKIDDVLKKAGLESELRKQFIQLVNENPSLKSLKVSDILSSYLREFVKDSDRQYYKAIDEPLSNELENILIDYFDKFKIRRQELDNLKEKFGVDSVGVFDVLAKTVYYAKNRNLLTLPEEYGHVFVELLGSIGNKKADNPLFKYMFDNIDKWDGYQRVLRDYKDVYVTKEGNMDIYKIKKEAIGQAIGIALVRNYKVQKGDEGFWKKIQEVIDYILNLIKGIDYVSLNTTVDSIAKDILNKNYDKLDRMKKDTSNYNLLTYSETIKNQNKIDGGRALKFMQWFSKAGMLITGSLAYRLQGTTYRPEIDALHDIDNIVPSDIHKVSLNKQDYLTPEQLESSRLYYKYISEGNYREAKKYKLQGNIRLNINDIVNNVEVLQDFKKEFPETDFLYSFYNEKANAFYITINAIWSENQELKDRFKLYTGSFNSRLENFTKEELEQIYLFDFFLRPESSEEYIKIEDEEYNLSLAHFNYAFYEKLNMMGRAKDAFDYQMWDYYDENNILAPDFNDRLVYFQLPYTEKNEVKLGVQELFDSNPELANQVYEALGFRTPNITVLPNGNLKIVAFRTEKVGPTSKGEYQRGKGLYLSLDRPYPGEDVYTVEIEVSPKNLLDRKLGFGKISEDYFIDEKNKRVDKQLDTLHEFKQSLGIKAEIGSIDGALMNELVLFDKDLINQALNSKQQYNPQQKQQALQLYSQYLDTVFPDSKVKDIVSHNSPNKFDKFNVNRGRLGVGVYFGLDYKIYNTGQYNYKALLNIKNLKRYDKGDFVITANNLYPSIDEYSTEPQDKLRKADESNGIDGYVSTSPVGTEFLVFEPEQIHILGSKQDIEGFKEFVGKITTLIDTIDPIQNIVNKINSNFTEEDLNNQLNNCKI